MPKDLLVIVVALILGATVILGALLAQNRASGSHASQAPKHGIVSPAQAKAWLKRILIVALVIALAVFGWRLWEWRERKQSQSNPSTSEQAEKVRESTQGPEDTSFTSVLVSQMLVRTPLTAPAGDEWSEWIIVRSGENFFICQSDEGLECSSLETDIGKIAFRIQCKDLAGRTHDWSEAMCRKATAFRVQSKNGEIRTIHWTEPY